MIKWLRRILDQEKLDHPAAGADIKSAYPQPPAAFTRDELPNKFATMLAHSNFESSVQSFALERNDERARIVNYLIEVVNNYPHIAKHLRSSYYEDRYGENVLYKAARLSLEFCEGYIDAAERWALSLYDAERSDQFALFAARALFANNKPGQGIELLQTHIQKTGSSREIFLELASAQYRMKQTNTANETLNFAHISPDIDGEHDCRLEIERALDEGTLDRKIDQYDDQYTQWIYNYYFSEFTGAGQFQRNEGWQLGLNMKILSQAISDFHDEFESVVNFGVLCGFSDYLLAKQFQGKTFTGIDRQAFVRKLNEASFDVPNLRFEAGDAINYLDNGDNSRKLLIHIRTAVLCYPEYLRRLYDTCSKKNVTYIVGVEPFAINHSTMRYSDFNNMPAISQPLRSIMFIHDYKTLLESAGFDVVRFDFHAQPFLLGHVPGDNIISFVARRT